MWEKISREELRELYSQLETRGDRYYNGCDFDELIHRYGVGNVKHEFGAGYFKKVGSITHKQSMAGYEVACQFGVFEQRAFDLVQKMFEAFHNAETKQI